MISSLLHLLKPSLWNALIRLRKPSYLERLSQLDSPGEFIDEMFLAAGRNLAVAAGFLASGARHEGKIAFLCCRALDAHEDLNFDPNVAAKRILETADYLQSKCAYPPPPPADCGRRESDQLEFIVACRLTWLRNEVARLPAWRRKRVEALIDNLARAMVACLQPRLGAATHSIYGELVLGRVVRYSLDLMDVDVVATVDPAPIGRLCQAINHLRDLHDDAPNQQEDTGYDMEAVKTSLWLELAEAATVITSVLRDLRFAKEAPGSRAAVVYMTITTLKAIARQAKYPMPWLTLHPLCGAVMADAFCSIYQWTLLQMDRMILGILVHLAQQRGDTEPSLAAAMPKVWGGQQDAFESTLADQHPDPSLAILLKHSCRLLRYSILLTSNLPQAALFGRPTNTTTGQLLMISDYLMAAALKVVQPSGLPAVCSFSRAGAAISDDLQKWPESTDHEGHLAAFLTEVVGIAQRTPKDQRESLCTRNSDISRQLHLQDRQNSLLNQLKLNLFG